MRVDVFAYTTLLVMTLFTMQQVNLNGAQEAKQPRFAFECIGNDYASMCFMRDNETGQVVQIRSGDTDAYVVRSVVDSVDM